MSYTKKLKIYFEKMYLQFSVHCRWLRLVLKTILFSLLTDVVFYWPPFHKVINFITWLLRAYMIENVEIVPVNKTFCCFFCFFWKIERERCNSCCSSCSQIFSTSIHHKYLIRIIYDSGHRLCCNKRSRKAAAGGRKLINNEGPIPVDCIGRVDESASCGKKWLFLRSTAAQYVCWS